MSFSLCVDVSYPLLGHHLFQAIAATGLQLPPVLQNQVSELERETCKEKFSPPSRELP